MFSTTNISPLSFLLDIGTFGIEIHDEKVKLSVADNSAVVLAKINELKCSLKRLEIHRHLVGIDFKSNQRGKVLLLCVENHCLIIQLCRLDCVPKTLKRFLADETICFVGTGMSNIVQVLQYDDIHCGAGIDVGYLAARIWKEPNIERYGLVELAGEVGMNIKEPIGECPDWNDSVFSDEQMKYAVHNAYTSYVIGNKLLCRKKYLRGPDSDFYLRWGGSPKNRSE